RTGIIFEGERQQFRYRHHIGLGVGQRPAAPGFLPQLLDFILHVSPYANFSPAGVTRQVRNRSIGGGPLRRFSTLFFADRGPAEPLSVNVWLPRARVLRSARTVKKPGSPPPGFFLVSHDPVKRLSAAKRS